MVDENTPSNDLPAGIVDGKDAEERHKVLVEEVRLKMDLDANYPLGEKDAMKWAIAWGLIRDRNKIDANVDTDGWMVSWFANAMASAHPSMLMHDVNFKGVMFPGYKDDQPNTDCLAKKHPDEPWLAILGRDPDGPFMADLWAMRREVAASSIDDPQLKQHEANHIASVREIAHKMRDWQKEGHKPDTAPPAEAYPNTTSQGQTVMSKENTDFVEPIVYPTLEETIEKIHQWGVDRNIIGGATSLAQFPKLIEEYGEYTTGRSLYDQTMIKDGIGDTLVVATMIAGIENIPMIPGAPEIVKLVGTGDFDKIGLSVVTCLGAIGGALARRNTDSLYETLSTLTTLLGGLAVAEGTSLAECAAIAYDEIKDRRGVMYNGVFIKSSDERYADICKEFGKPVD